jgi:hypothetical protein
MAKILKKSFGAEGRKQKAAALINKPPPDAQPEGKIVIGVHRGGKIVVANKSVQVFHAHVSGE